MRHRESVGNVAAKQFANCMSDRKSEDVAPWRAVLCQRQKMIKLPRIMVAPNGARRTKADHPELPITQAEIVATAIACQHAGAGGIHIHFRDANGVHSLDPTGNAQLIKAIRSHVPGLLIQITTETAGMFDVEDQMALVRTLWPRFVSIAPREILGPVQI